MSHDIREQVARLEKAMNPARAYAQTRDTPVSGENLKALAKALEALPEVTVNGESLFPRTCAPKFKRYALGVSSYRPADARWVNTLTPDTLYKRPMAALSGIFDPARRDEFWAPEALRKIGAPCIRVVISGYEEAPLDPIDAVMAWKEQVGDLTPYDEEYPELYEFLHQASEKAKAELSEAWTREAQAWLDRHGGGSGEFKDSGEWLTFELSLEPPLEDDPRLRARAQNFTAQEKAYNGPLRTGQVADFLGLERAIEMFGMFGVSAGEEAA